MHGHRRGIRVAGLLSGIALMMALATPGALTAAEDDKDGTQQTAKAVQVDLNTASEEQLQSVPGIGPALAKRIVEFREQNGPFGKVDDVLKVRGIGEKSLEKLRPYLKVEKGK